ncbi:MAG: extracellular solute-binding protein [Anaerolineae bacterium]|nr:extracellular solute-binding protein [Anaerolineae bacterium]
MRSLSRRELLRSGIMGAMGLFLASCKPKTVEVTRVVEKVVKETVVVKEAAKVIVLRHMLRAGDLGSRYDRALIEFSDTHPNMKYKLEPIPGGDPEYVPKVMAMHAAGTIGDSCWTSIGSVNHYQYADMGITTPLDDLIESANFDKSAYYENAWPSASYNGKIYGLPETIHPGTAMLVYNKTLFEKEGVPEPNENWTLDDLLETAKLFTRDTDKDGKVDMWGFLPSTGRLIVMLIRCFSGYEYDMINPEGTKAMVNQPKTKEALRWVADLYQKYKVCPTPEALESGFNQLFIAGRVAMFQTGCWGGPGVSNTMRAKKEWPIEWWVTELPKGPSKVLGSHSELDCQCITSQCKHKREAFDFIVYLVDKEGSVLRGLPYGCPGARKDQWDDPRLQGTRFTKDDKALFKIYDSIYRKAGPYYYPANLQGQQAFQVYKQGLDPLWLGKAEPTDAFFDDVNKQLQTVLDMPKAGASK